MLYAVILAGGRGTRFWPLSRRALPKQCLSLDGGPTLIQRTYARVLPIIPGERVLVVTGTEMADAIREQLPDLPAENLLIEPSSRNTAPVAAWTAWEVARRGGGTICVLPSDHMIQDEAAFRTVLTAAMQEASTRAGSLVTLGIRPTHPETGFGYIEPAPGDGPVRAVQRFVEKPNRARAEELILAGCFWNAGMFCWRSDTVQAAVRAFLPRTAGAMDRLIAGEPLATAWADTDATSVDYGILERSTDIRVIPGDFGWSDVGSWPALAEVLPAQAWGCGVGEVSALRATGNIVYAPHKLVALLGVDDLVVVDTPDVLLVTRKAAGQQVKDILEQVDRSWPGKHD